MCCLAINNLDLRIIYTFNQIRWVSTFRYKVIIIPHYSIKKGAIIAPYSSSDSDYFAAANNSATLSQLTTLQNAPI